MAGYNLPGRRAKMRRGGRNEAAGFGGRTDAAFSRFILAVSTVGILLMIFILAFLMVNGLPVLREASLRDIFLSRDWYPVEEPPALGMLALIAGTASASALSSLLALPVSVALAIFTAEIVPKRVRGLLKVLLELLGFVPSIVLGFVGMMVIAPWMQKTLHVPSGLNLLTVSLLMGFLIIPLVASLSEEALSAVPDELRDASYALGATRWETISRVTVPYALPGILSACLLGVMRALGETMVVLMAAGSAAIIPTRLTDPVRPLTSTIAAEMGETPVGSAHYHALFFAGLILLAVTLLINLAAIYIEKRGKSR